jgi:hypothetical protein
MRRSASSLISARQRKAKCRPTTFALRGPELTLMTLDDGSADPETHAHTVCFRRIVGLEKPIDGHRAKARPRVLNRHHDTARIAHSSNLQRARDIDHAAHRFDAVDRQIENDLLQLDPVCPN